MLKLVRFGNNDFALISDKGPMRGSFEDVIRQLIKFKVTFAELHLAVDEFEMDRLTPHNVAHFGIGLKDRRPKFVFSEYVDIKELDVAQVIG